ncbi:hypothetical protein [Bacillus sp. T3]|uniref:hypothetical protein n=1 Tax=Bacillus sp. T3 TaxID=467262 RepID=UPI00298287B7|nr:hypothetical protein [Bacillus sp. T3]
MQKKNVVSYLENMVGKELKIYKDGPESKTGRLISVNKDLIAIKTEDNQTVYYQLKHIKSIIENAKHGKGWDNTDADDINEIKATNFQHLLKQLLQQKIQINGGGPAHRIAKVLEVKEDYVVLLMKNNEVIYYQLEHIKSISAVDEKSSSDRVESSESSESESENIETTEFDETPDYTSASDFESLLKKLKHNWVIINGKGPEHIHGILVDYALDHVVLVHHDEVFRIYTYHIKNISLGAKKGHKQQKEEVNGKERKETEPEEKETSKKLVKYSSKVSKVNGEPEKNTNKGKNMTKFRRNPPGPKKP